MSYDTATNPAGIKDARQHIADTITARIATGHYTLKLPGERALATEFAVSYTTIRHATAILRDRNLIVSMQGRGTYIAAALTRAHPARADPG